MTDASRGATPPADPPHDTRTETHSEPGPGDPHGGADDHGADHGHDDHGHAEEPLGPVDVWAWGAGALGLLIAGVIVFCFALATDVISIV